MLAGYLPFDDDPQNPNGSNITQLYRYITTTPLTFPDYVKPMPRDLLRRILVSDPETRADLLEVRAHSWLLPYTKFLSVKPKEWESMLSPQPETERAMRSSRHSMISPGIPRSTSVRDTTSHRFSYVEPTGSSHRRNQSSVGVADKRRSYAASSETATGFAHTSSILPSSSDQNDIENMQKQLHQTTLQSSPSGKSSSAPLQQAPHQTSKYEKRHTIQLEYTKPSTATPRAMMEPVRPAVVNQQKPQHSAAFAPIVTPAALEEQQEAIIEQTSLAAETIHEAIAEEEQEATPPLSTAPSSIPRSYSSSGPQNKRRSFRLSGVNEQTESASASPRSTNSRLPVPTRRSRPTSMQLFPTSLPPKSTSSPNVPDLLKPLPPLDDMKNLEQIKPSARTGAVGSGQLDASTVPSRKRERPQSMFIPNSLQRQDSVAAEASATKSLASSAAIVAAASASASASRKVPGAAATPGRGHRRGQSSLSYNAEKFFGRIKTTAAVKSEQQQQLPQSKTATQVKHESTMNTSNVRKFNSGYEEKRKYGGTGPARKVMDFFRRRGTTANVPSA